MLLYFTENVRAVKTDFSLLAETLQTWAKTKMVTWRN